MVFVGRERELSNLERLYSMEESSACAVFGRRRVGKTSLILEFCKDKHALVLLSSSKNRESIFFNYSQSISGFLGRETEIKDERDLARLLTECLSVDGKTVLVIDEFPFLVDACPDFPSMMQYMTDIVMKKTPSMLIVSGSSMGAMANILNDGRGPLFMRFSLQMKLEPLRYKEARLLNPGMSEEDRMRVYSIAGGIPMYHTMLNGDIERSVSDVLLRPSGMLNTESEGVLSLELNPWESYRKVLESLGTGGRDINEIVNVTGLSKSYCIKLLDDLKMLGVVTEDNPYGMKRKTLFRISDGLMNFRFSVIERHENILSMYPDNPYDMLRGSIETLYGRRFETICRQYVTSTRRCKWIGGWWGNVPVISEGVAEKDASGKTRTVATDIDIVAVESDRASDVLLLCECKFTNRPMDTADLGALISDGSCVKWNGRRRYILFSRSGFTPRLVCRAEDSPEDVELVDMDRMTEWAEMPDTESATSRE